MLVFGISCFNLSIVLVGCTIILGVTIVIPICMIVMGSVYLRECPQGEYIPVYLLVGGKHVVLQLCDQFHS